MTQFFQMLIQSNTLNFLIVLALVFFLVKKLNVGQKLESIRSEIQDFVNESQNEKQLAEKSLADIEDKIEDLPNEIEKIKASSELSVKSIDEKLKSDTESKKADIANNADRIMQLEIKKFKSKLTSVLSEKSVEMACQNAKNQLNQNKELHNFYIENAINELDRIVL